MKRIGAIVVTFNGERWVDRCFSHLINEAVIEVIYVIDNGSSDQTLPQIKALESKKIIIVENKANLGFGRANNLGIKLALTQHVDGLLLINQDAWLLNDSLGKMIRVLESNVGLGVVSPVHLDGSGNAFDQAFDQYISEVLSDEQKNQILCKEFKRDFFEVPFVNAACWLFNPACVNKVGLFDTLFRHYGEDNNYIQRLKYHELKVAIVNGSFVIHDRKHRIENKFHKFTETRYRYYLMIMMNINSPIFKSVFFCLSENFKLSIDHIKGLDFNRLLKGYLALLKCLILMPRILKHRRKNKKFFR